MQVKMTHSNTAKRQAANRFRRLRANLQAGMSYKQAARFAPFASTEAMRAGEDSIGLEALQALAYCDLELAVEKCSLAIRNLSQ